MSDLSHLSPEALELRNELLLLLLDLRHQKDGLLTSTADEHQRHLCNEMSAGLVSHPLVFLRLFANCGSFRGKSRPSWSV
jgi:hypothetical protein